MIVECPGCQSRYDVTGRPPGTRARCRCGSVFELPAPTSAAMLECPRCGGDVSATNHRCEYCEVELKVKACPRCFARMFQGSRHCTQCGASVIQPAAAAEDGTATRRPCPRCEDGAELESQLVGDVLLDECPGCHGIFLDIAALERVLTERRQVRAEAVLGRTRRDGIPVVPHPGGAMYVCCPDCGQRMNRRNFAAGAGVIVDVCRAHGTWFDANELPRIIDFVMEGGLERSERAEIERLREEARRAQEAARSASALGGALGPVHMERTTVFTGLLGAIGSILLD